MAVITCSHTGTQWMMTGRVLSYWETACTWTSVVVGEELTVKCFFQERSATSLRLVSFPSPFFSIPFPGLCVSSRPFMLIRPCVLLPSGTFCLPVSESIAFSSDVVCPETWVKFRGSCYNFKPVVLRMPLEEAREHCRKKGTKARAYSKHGVLHVLHLVSVKSGQVEWLFWSVQPYTGDAVKQRSSRTVVLRTRLRLTELQSYKICMGVPNKRQHRTT